MAQDYLREQLMMEKELKTFQSEEAISTALPSDVSSKATTTRKPDLVVDLSFFLSISSGLSYWLARRLPIDEPKKLELLSIDSPILRLVRGLQILKVMRLDLRESTTPEMSPSLSSGHFE